MRPPADGRMGFGEPSESIYRDYLCVPLRNLAVTCHRRTNLRQVNTCRVQCSESPIYPGRRIGVRRLVRYRVIGASGCAEVVGRETPVQELSITPWT